MALPEGTYDITVFPTGKDRVEPLQSKRRGSRFPAARTSRSSLHLTADGKPVLTPYVNDVSQLKAGQARLTVRHDAAAPAVDVRAGGTPVFKGLTNPNEAKADLPAGTVKADVVLAGTSTVVIGPAELNLAEGTSTIVYAWGSAQDKNLKLAVQTIGGTARHPRWRAVPGRAGSSTTRCPSPSSR